MATKSSSYILSVWLLTAAFLSGCAGLERRPSEPPEVQVPKEKESGPEVVDVPEQEPLPLPAPVAPKVGVILGPGLINTYAHIGVLKAFEESKIPIQAIAGLEWGSLPAALYGTKGLAHEVEWKMLRLEREDLPDKGFFSSRIKPRDVKTLTNFFEKTLKGEQIQNGQISFHCPTLSLERGRVYWHHRGALASALYQCMAYPPYFESDKGFYAAPFSVSGAAEQLRSRGAEFVIYVDVLTGSPLFRKEDRAAYLPEYLLWSQVAEASTQTEIEGVNRIIHVSVPTDIYNFDGRRSLVEKGLRTARPLLQELANQYSF